MKMAAFNTANNAPLNMSGKRCMTKKTMFKAQSVLFFLILFGLYIFRTPDDLFTPYLWAEDGTVLISEAVYNGISMIFTKQSGTLWILQRVLALICYWACLPFGNIELLPYIMMIVFKMICVFGIAYFMSDRFAWLVPGMGARCFICGLVILMIPQESIDVMLCDTSIPFILFFDVFLIALDLLCAKKAHVLSVPQTAFLSLLSLSYAGAGFIAIMVALVDLRWLVDRLKAKAFEWKEFAFEFAKTAVIMTAVLIQLKTILSAGRVSGNLDILSRIIANTKAFIFFPYWQNCDGWGFFFIGIICWASFIWIAKLQWKTVVYCTAFSWIYMLYCSFANEVEDFYPLSANVAPRYYLTSVMIATFMCGYIVINMLESQQGRSFVITCKRALAFLMIVVCAVKSVMTYKISAPGADFAYDYELYSFLYKECGKDALNISIAPWNPWSMKIPIDFSYETENDLEFGITFVGFVGEVNVDETTQELLPFRHDNHDTVGGWCSTSESGEAVTRLIIKMDNGEYRAADSIVDNKFEFCLRDSEIDADDSGDCIIELYGQTEDGVWHYGELAVGIEFY